jgi:DNA helicase II / ATP-dependent DNA helicase PcrA
MSTVRYEPGQLARLLGLPEPTAEQAEVIAAPLEPLAVIAGAGSGKSETMAARLVWLVANGMVRPERVLGLTFTRKAAAELGQRVRTRLADLRRAGLDVTGGDPAVPGSPGSPAGHELGGGPAGGRLGGRAGADLASGAVLGSLDGRVPGDLSAAVAPGLVAGELPGDDLLDGEPIVSTYHSYAARLVADHALREAQEPTVRLITPAVAWQMAARVVAAYAGPMDAVHWAPQSVTAAVLDLAGELAEHLANPADI